MNVNINIQHNGELTYNQLRTTLASFNTPSYADLEFEKTRYGWEINIHWNTDVSKR